MSYFSFRGTVSRKRFWFVYFLPWVGALMLGLTLDFIAFTPPGGGDPVGMFFMPLFWLMFLWPFLAGVAKRERDMGRSPWHALWFFVPFVGFLIVLADCTGRSKEFNEKKMA